VTVRAHQTHVKASQIDSPLGRYHNEHACCLGAQRDLIHEPLPDKCKVTPWPDGLKADRYYPIESWANALVNDWNGQMTGEGIGILPATVRRVPELLNVDFTTWPSSLRKAIT
jgi:hypothetical protein